MDMLFVFPLFLISFIAGSPAVSLSFFPPPTSLSLNAFSAVGSLILTAITMIFNLLNEVFFLLVTWIWQYIFPFLTPTIAFPSIPYTNIPPPHVFGIPSPTDPSFPNAINSFVLVSANWSLYFINNLVIPILGLMIIVYGLVYAFDVIRGRGEALFDTLPKIVFGVILAFTSLMLASLLMEFGRALYGIIYYGVDFNGVHLYGINSLHDSPWPNLSSSTVIMQFGATQVGIFILMFILISMLVAFLIMLAVRLVWIFVSLMLIPIASILYPFQYFEDIGKKIWINFIEKGFDMFLMGLPLLLLPWIKGFEFGQTPNSVDFEATAIFTIAILAVAMGLPYFLSKVGAPVYPNPGSLLQNVGTTAVQTGAQAIMLGTATGMIMAGGAVSGFASGLGHMGGIGKITGSNPLVAGGSGLGVEGSVQASQGVQVVPAVSQAPAGGRFGIFSHLHGVARGPASQHLPHIRESLHKGDMHRLAGHAFATPITYLSSLLGYGLGRGVGKLLERGALKYIREHGIPETKPGVFHLFQRHAYNLGTKFGERMDSHGLSHKDLVSMREALYRDPYAPVGKEYMNRYNLALANVPEKYHVVAKNVMDRRLNDPFLLLLKTQIEKEKGGGTQTEEEKGGGNAK
ncbi:MAG: hypothetical protein ACP5G5_06820 [Thermoplasmata archaeon]